MSDDHHFVPVQITAVDEQWSTVTLIDGSVIKTKLVYTKVSAVYNSKNEHLKGPDGILLYALEHALVHTVNAPLGNVQTSNARN